MSDTTDPKRGDNVWILGTYMTKFALCSAPLSPAPLVVHGDKGLH
jgi:hypothetical protein